MIKRPDQVAFAQAVVFFPAGSELSAQGIVRQLPQKHVERLGSDPFITPRMEGMPREVPLLQWTGREGREILTIAPARADFRNVNWREGESLSLFFAEAAELLFAVCGAAKVEVNRLAAVAHRFSPHAEAPRELAGWFCHSKLIERGPLNRPMAFELHAHKQFRSKRLGFPVNSWVRNKSGFLKADNSPIVLVEQDINTVADATEQTRFREADVRGFFSEIVAEMDEALALYYSTEQQA